MTEVEVKNVEIERFEGEKPLDITPIKTITKSRNFKGYLEGCLKKAINSRNRELEALFREILIKYKQFTTKSIIIERIGFKRDGHSYNIYKGFDNDYRIWLYEADSPIIIDKDKINFILQLIVDLPIGEHYYAKYFFNKIIKHYKLNLNINEFSGGVNRAKFYFPLYLAPMKIIEKELGIIKVVIGKGGGIIRLN